MNPKIFALLFAVLFFAGACWAGNITATSLSYDPAPVSPGSAVTVWVQVKNDSVYLSKDVVVDLVLEFPFSLQPGEEAERSIGQLGPFETATVEYKLLVDAKAINGTNTIKALTGEGFPTRTNSFAVNILSRTPKLEIVKSDTELLAPGEAQPVTLTIKNIGGSIAKDIVLKVNPDRTVTSTGIVVEREIVSLGASSNYLAYLNIGEEKDVTLTLAVNQGAARKNYSIPITMEYFDQNGTAKTGTAYLGIKVSAEAQVDAVINNVSPAAFPGGTSEITVDLFNIGLADARYAVIEISGQNADIEEPRQFIGTLEADDFDSFKTKISISPSAQIGVLPLNLKIIYKDEELNEKTIDRQLYLNVVSAAEAQGGTSPLLVLFGLASLALELIGIYVAAKWAWPKAKAFASSARMRKAKK